MPFWDVKPNRSPVVSPAEMLTVAPARFRLSTSLRVRLEPITIGVAFSVNPVGFETEICSFQFCFPKLDVNVQSGLPVGLFPRPMSGLEEPWLFQAMTVCAFVRL